MKKKYLIYSIICLILSLIILGILGVRIFISILNISGIVVLFLLVLLFILIYLTCLFLCKYKDNKDIMRKCLVMYFVLYILLVFILTIFNRGLLNSSPIVYAFENIGDCFRKSNFVPFYDTYLFIKENIIDGTYYRLSLVLGNFLLFIPLSYLLPRLFKRQNNFIIFIVTVILMTLSIELIQVFTLTGTFDIDDIILNSMGAIIMFGIFNKGFLGKILDKILLLSDTKIEKKDIVKSIIVLLSIILLVGVSIYFYYLDDPAISVSIIDEVNTCDGEKELVYENFYYKYYFPCKKSDKVFIVFDKKYKYTIKDYLEGNNVKKKYLGMFDASRLDVLYDLFEVESKGYDISVFVENGYTFSPIVDSEFLYLRGVSSSGDEKGNHTYIFLIEPKKSGETYISFEIKDRESLEVVRIDKYKVIINDDFSIKYEMIK